MKVHKHACSTKSKAFTAQEVPDFELIFIVTVCVIVCVFFLVIGSINDINFM